MTADPDFVADDDFAAEDYFPFAPVQQWAALCADIGADALGVLTFTMCHLNPMTGKFDASFGRKRVAERFGRSLDWVDKRFNELIAAGAMTRQHMFWADPANRGPQAPRTPEQIDPETGKKRPPAPNKWRVRMRPPGGSGYCGPVNIGEFYKPKRVDARRGVPATERPTSDQRKRKKTPAQGVAAVERPGVAAVERLGVAAVERPELSSSGTTTDMNPSVRSESNARAAHEPAATDGRTDGDSLHEPSPAAAMVAAPAIQADLKRIDLRASQRRALTAAVDAALLRFSESQVSRYLATKARDAQTATWLLDAFRDWSDTIAEVPRPWYERQADALADATLAAAVDAAVDAFAAEHRAEPVPVAARVRQPRLEWCGECDEADRRISVTDEHGHERLAHCPLCSPRAAESGRGGSVHPAR